MESTRDFNKFEKRWGGDYRVLLKSKNYFTRKCESQTTLGLLVKGCLKNLGQIGIHIKNPELKLKFQSLLGSLLDHSHKLVKITN